MRAAALRPPRQHRTAARWVFSAALAALLANPAHALDLWQAYQAALQHDAQLRAAQAQARAQRERLPQAQAQLLPQLALGASVARNDLTRTQPNILGQSVTSEEFYNSHNATLGVRWGVWRPAARADVRVAQALVADADATEQTEVANLAVRTAAAYFDALLARYTWQLAERAVQIAQVQRDAAQKAYDAGTGTRTDVDDVQAQLDLRRADALRARLQWEVALRQLLALTGVAVADLPAFNPALDPVAAPAPANLQHWLDRALAQNPELQALRARRDAAAAALERAQAQHQPTVDAIAQIVRSRSENTTAPATRYTNRLVGVQLNWPLYTGGATQSQVRQALAELERAQAQLDAAERELGVRLQREWRAALDGAERVRALQTALDSAEQAVLANQRSLQAGVRSRLDVLAAERRRDDAARALAQARFEQLLARLRLIVLAGDDPTAELRRSAEGWKPEPAAAAR